MGKLKLALVVMVSIVLTGCQGAKQVAPAQVKLGSHPAVTPEDKPKQEWQDRHNAFVERVKKGNVDLLFIGDSITHGWESKGKNVWQKYYGNRNAVNLGIGGDSTQHVLWRLDHGEIAGISPKLAVVMIGTNNSNGDYCTSEQIADGIIAIVQKLRSDLPNTKVLLLAIFPRGDAEQRKDKVTEGSYNAQWAKNEKASKIASKIADNKMVFYLDINKKFLNNKGVLTRDVMPDLLHPNEKGYEIWAEAIEPSIVKLMK
jgi:beta-glucosidase